MRVRIEEMRVKQTTKNPKNGNEFGLISEWDNDIKSLGEELCFFCWNFWQYFPEMSSQICKEKNKVSPGEVGSANQLS